MPWSRLRRWVERFDEKHPGASWQWKATEVRVSAPDGARAAWDVPFPPLTALSRDGFLEHLTRPRLTGVLLVRRGGFAVALARDAGLVEAKVGRRHVQGRTKAGGQSQQRFARRRDNQARVAFDAAATHAAAILAVRAVQLDELVVGGDREAIERVLRDQRLNRLVDVPRTWVEVPADPRRAALDAALTTARSVDIEVLDPTWC